MSGTLTASLAAMMAGATELEAVNHAVLTGDEPEPALTESQDRLRALLQEADGLAADLAGRLAVLRRRLVREAPPEAVDLDLMLPPIDRVLGRAVGEVLTVEQAHGLLSERGR